jgi:hypothetical protein
VNPISLRYLGYAWCGTAAVGYSIVSMPGRHDGAFIEMDGRFWWFMVAFMPGLLLITAAERMK